MLNLTRLTCETHRDNLAKKQIEKLNFQLTQS